MNIGKCLTVSWLNLSENTQYLLHRALDYGKTSLDVCDMWREKLFVGIPPNMIEKYPNGEGIPNDLWEYMLLAHNNNCEWLIFDEEYDGEMESCELEPVHMKRDSIIKEVIHNLAGFIYDNDLAIGDDACRWKTGESKVDCESLGLRNKENCLKCFDEYLDLAE